MSLNNVSAKHTEVSPLREKFLEQVGGGVVDSIIKRTKAALEDIDSKFGNSPIGEKIKGDIIDKGMADIKKAEGKMEIG